MLGYGGTFTYNDATRAYDFVPVLNGFFWSMTGLIVIGGVVAAAGGLVQLVAWIGALVNTYQVPDKTWFAVVLGGGVLGLFFGLIGFAAMVAYVIAGPDGNGSATGQAGRGRAGSPRAHRVEPSP